jgi:hypothetical protein
MKRLSIICLAVAFIGMTSLLAHTQEPKAEEKLATLEGTLKVHPKFMYKYYIVAYGGQTCALYTDSSVGGDIFEGIKPGTEIRVHGKLRTRYHGGGTKTNPSPFGRTWVIYMNVRETKELSKDKG